MENDFIPLFDHLKQINIIDDSFCVMDGGKLTIEKKQIYVNHWSFPNYEFAHRKV